MNPLSNINTELLDALLKNLKCLIEAKEVQPNPPEALAKIDGYPHLYATLLEIRSAIMSFANGDLNYKVAMKGYLPGAIKTLQASLSHLTWQTKMIASGDFSQRVDFMGDFSESFNSMVAQLSESMQKLELIARIDPLTGINNRGHFMELLHAELERSSRYSRVFCLLMFDLDHFKQVNDTRGHAAGDEALRSLSRVFKTVGLRNSDFCGRIGGEEFSLVLPETGINGAVVLAERLREKLEITAIVSDEKEFYVTASIGVSQYINGDTLESLLERADQAMYQAKKTGRNRVCKESLSADQQP